MVTNERKREIDKRLAAIGEELAAISKEVGRNLVACASPVDDWAVTVIDGTGDNSVHYSVIKYDFWDEPRTQAAVTKDGVFRVLYEDYLDFLNWGEGARDE